MLRAGRNSNHGFEKRTLGGSRRIVGRKAVWFKLPLVESAIPRSRKVIAQGHIKRVFYKSGA
jgi:hypothetical protein